MDNVISQHIQSEADNFFSKQEIVDKLNLNVQSEAQAQYQQDMKSFQLELEKEIMMKSTKVKNVNVGEFNFVVQEDCSIVNNTPPAQPSLLEKDCFSAKVMADVTANLIIQTVPSHPPTIESLRDAITSCDLSIKTNETFSIFNECYSDDLGTDYKKILDDQFDLIGSSFGLTHLGEGEFERKNEIQLNLDHSEAQITTTASGVSVPLQ